MARVAPPRNRRRKQPPKQPMFDPLAALSPGALQNQAEREAEASLAPVRTELERLRKESAANFANRSANIAGFGQAGAKMLQPIAGQIGQAYQSAAGETAHFAQGYADAQAQLAAARSQGDQNLLATAGPQGGAPAGQGAAVAQAAGAGAGGTGTNLHDLVYSQGEMPAAGLAREGAAFQASAAMLPGALLSQSMLAVGKNEADAKKAEDDFVAQLTELEQKRPGLINDILKDLRNNELQKAATRINRAYLGIKRDQVKADAATKATQLGLDSSEVDEQLSAGNGFLTNKYGQPILDHGQQVPYHKFVAPPKPPRPGSGPQAKRNKAIQVSREKMFADAQSWMVTGTNKATGVTETKPKYTYQQARNILWNKYGQALMGYASAGGKAALRKQVNQMINQALAQIGLKPPAPSKKNRNPQHPGGRPT